MPCRLIAGLKGPRYRFRCRAGLSGPPKYLARVDARGRADEVRRDTITISSAEMIVIGTTGRKPRTVVPAVTRVITSICPIETSGTTLPGGGAVTTDWITATVSTPAAVHT